MFSFQDHISFYSISIQFKDIICNLFCILNYFLFLMFFFIEVELIYNVVSISAVQQGDSVIHRDILFFIFFSIMVYPRRLDIVPCAIDRTLLFIHSKCNSLHLLTPNSLSIPVHTPSLATTSLFSSSKSSLVFNSPSRLPDEPPSPVCSLLLSHSGNLHPLPWL